MRRAARATATVAMVDERRREATGVVRDQRQRAAWRSTAAKTTETATARVTIERVPASVTSSSTCCSVPSGVLHVSSAEKPITDHHGTCAQPRARVGTDASGWPIRRR